MKGLNITLDQKIKMAGTHNIYFYLSMLFATALPLSWKFAKIVLFILLVVGLFEITYTKNRHFISYIRNSPLLTSMILFASYQLISFLWTSEGVDATYPYLRSYLFWFCIPILAYKLNRRSYSPIISSFLFGMLISELVSYGMLFELWTINGRGSEYPIPFMHHTAYSIFIAFSAIILLNRILSSEFSPKEKILMGIFFITLNGNLFIALGRIGQIAYICALIFTGILHFKMRIKTILLFSGLAFFIIFSAYHLSPSFKNRILSAKSDIQKIMQNNLNSSWGYRVAYIIVGSEIIKDNLIIGVGIGDTKKTTADYLLSHDFNFSSALKSFLPQHHFHNQYIMTFVQGGLIGLILMLIIFYYYFRLRIDDDELHKLSKIFPLIMLILFMSEPPFSVGNLNAFFILFTSLFAIDYKQVH